MRKAIALAMVITLAPTRAAADPLPTDHVVLKSGTGMLEVAGHSYVLPQFTQILTPIAWDRLDSEVKRLQDSELRLTTENTYIKKRVSGWRPSWQVIGIATLTGLATGVYIGHKL